MFISELCRSAGVTRKAVNYYIEQGLLTARYEENGYRCFTKEDLNTVREISTLRRFGLLVDEIKRLRESTDKRRVLSECLIRKRGEQARLNEQLEGISYLIENGCDVEGAGERYGVALDAAMTIKEKLRLAFPGVWGDYLSVHFGRFLTEKIDTLQKREAYRRVVDYIDSAGVQFPREVEELLKDSFPVSAQQADDGLHRTLSELETDISAHKEAMELYLRFTQSEEFKQSPAYQMKRLLLDFQKQSGYQEVFIENIKILSASYREYFDRLQALNDKFMQEYPELKTFC